jgi:hypothetical protein
MVTRAVSFPTPRMPPVTITTFPVWSGTLSTLQLGSGGKSWRNILIRLSDIAGEYCREGVSETRNWGGARAEGEDTTNDGTF